MSENSYNVENTEALEENVLTLGNIFSLVLHKWYWVLISVIFCLGLAFLYVTYKTPTYTRTASLRIKDDDQGSSVSDIGGFSDMGIFRRNTNVIDEMSSLESNTFLSEAVKRIDMNVSYVAPGKTYKLSLYGTTLPIKAEFIGFKDDASVKFKFESKAGGEITISDIQIGKDKIDGKKTALLGDTISLPGGKVVFKPAHAFKADEDYEMLITRSGLPGYVDGLRKRLTLELRNDDGNIIDISLTDASTQRAEDFLNTLIQVYNDHWIIDKNQIAVSTSNFINERLGIIESELGNVDQDISTFKSQNLIPDIGQASSIYMDQHKQISEDLISLGTQLQMSKYVNEYLNNPANRNKALPGNVGIDNVNLESQISQFNNALIERNAIAANSSERNPLVADYDSRIETMRGAIKEAIHNHIVALNTRIANLEQNERSTINQLASNPTQAKYLLSVERQQKVKEALYLFLLQKREENELSQAFTAYNSQIIDPANGTNLPAAPVKRNIYLIAFVAGLFFPVGIIYLMEVNNTKVRGRKDIENLKAPFLGEIPLHKKSRKDNSSGRIVVSEGRLDPLNESFRMLRTNFGFMTASNHAKVIMVTSFNPGSGKTFITMNLAVSLALKGQRVLVIDGDLRRATSSSYIDNPNTGLSNYLVGSVRNINDVIVRDSICPNLSVLPVGILPPNPTELLEKDEFAKLINDLRSGYDYIFIDCPPIEMMADAHIIEGLSDMTFFVIRAGLMERNMLPDLDKLYQNKKFKNITVILNGTEVVKGSRYSYGYGYGSYNYYGKKSKHN